MAAPLVDTFVVDDGTVVDGADASAGAASISIGKRATASTVKGITFILPTAAIPIGKVSGVAPSAFDNFNRADGALGSNWTIEGVPMFVAGNKVVGNGPSVNDSSAAWTANTFGTDQFSQITNMVVGSEWIGVFVRDQNGGQERYLVIYWNTVNVNLYKRVAGAYTQVGAYTTAALNPSDVLRIEAVGSAVLVKINGAVVINYTDPSPLVGGTVGIAAYGAPTGDDWQGGSLGVVSGTTVRGLTLVGGAAPLVVVGKVGATPLIVGDNFNRANNTSLGFGWAASGDGTPQIVSNQITGLDTSTSRFSAYTAQSFGSNQYSQITNMAIGPGGFGSWVGVLARSDLNAQNCYRAIYFYNSGTPVVRLTKRVAGIFTTLGSDYTIPGGLGALSPSDVLRIECVGTTIRALLNGTVAVSVTDSSFASGYPGLGVFAMPTADNWFGGEIAPGTTTVVRGIMLAGIGPAPLPIGRKSGATVVRGVTLLGSGTTPLIIGTRAAATQVRGVTLVAGAYTLAIGKRTAVTTVRGITFVVSGTAPLGVGHAQTLTNVFGMTLRAVGTVPNTVGSAPSIIVVFGVNVTATGAVSVLVGYRVALTVVYGVTLFGALIRQGTMHRMTASEINGHPISSTIAQTGSLTGAKVDAGNFLATVER